jgi:hypothetical protein
MAARPSLMTVLILITSLASVFANMPYFARRTPRRRRDDSSASSPGFIRRVSVVVTVHRHHVSSLGLDAPIRI